MRVFNPVLLYTAFCLIKLLETPNPALLYTAFLFDHPLMFQEKVRKDDAVHRTQLAKNLVDRHAGQVLGYLLSADSILFLYVLSWNNNG